MRCFGVGGLLLAGLGCGEVSGAPHHAVGAAGSGCEKGEIAGYSGACMPVGIPIQACAPMFIEEDGLCHPRMEKCAKGTIPKFDEGCVAVGIPRCAAVFLGADGLCRPSMAKCMSQPGTFAVPQEGCVPLDGPNGCGAGAWGDIPDEAGNIYVDPSAAAGGDGSKAKPVRTIAEAMTLVRDGGRIALAAGMYGEPAVISKSIELAGVCPSKVTIHGTAAIGGVTAIVAVDGAKAQVRGVSIGGGGIGLVALDKAQATLSHVHIAAATMFGAYGKGTGTSVSFDHSLIEDTIPVPGGMQDFGRGVEVDSGAHAVLAASAVVKNSESGLVAISTGAQVEADGSLIEGTLERNDKLGFGADAELGGVVAFKESAVVGNHNYGVFAGSAGAQVVASASLIAGTLPKEVSRMNGAGVAIRHGAHGTFQGNAIVDNFWAGINVEFDGATVSSTADLIADTSPEISDGDAGIGVDLHANTHLTLVSSAVVGNHAAGVHVEDAGTTATVTSALIEGTLSLPGSDYFGFGAEAVGGAQLTVAGSAIVGNHGVGLTAAEAGSALEVTTTLVEGTLPAELARQVGRGIEVDGASRLSIDATFINKNLDIGVAVDSTKDASVTHSLIQDTTGRPASGQDGFGLVCAGCSMTLSDTVLRGSSVTGVLVSSNASAVMTRVHVDGVKAGKTALLDATDTIKELGDGMVVNDGSTATMTDVLVNDVARSGVLFASSGGSVATTRVTKSQFGLVLDGSPKPALGPGNSFSGTERAKVTDGDLALPAVPPSIR